MKSQTLTAYFSNSPGLYVSSIFLNLNRLFLKHIRSSVTSISPEVSNLDQLFLELVWFIYN